jgi:hypothetical protein
MGRYHSENLGVEERVILKWSLRKQALRVWIGFMAQNRYSWRAVVNTVVNTRFK